MAVKKSIKQIISDEYKKCSQDPIHFMRKYCIIQHPTKGKMYFNLYPFQEDLLTEFNSNRYNIVLKSRQLGISTLSAGYSLWKMIFQSDYNVLVIATKQDVAKNLVTKVRVMHDNLPSWLKGKTMEDNKLSLRFKNGSQIKAISSKGDAGRSEALSLLVIDEAAFVDRIDEIWTAAQQTLATGGGAIMLSTPNGTGNLFHKTWCQAEAGGQFAPTKLHWSVHPERDQDWFAKETRNMSRREIAQELECNFNASGDTVVHGDDLKRILANVHEPIHKTGFDRNYWIWKEPEPHRDYLLAADVARGDGSDFSVAQVFDIETMEQVAEYQGKITPDMFGPLLHSIATEYNSALLVIENNSLGVGVLSRLQDLDYKNLYYSIKSTHEYVDEITAASLGGIGGFTMSMKTRPLVIAKLEEFVRNKLVTINSVRLANEIKTFVWHNGRPQAMRSYNDDLVIAACIGCWVRDTALTTNKREADYKMALLSSISVSTTSMNTKIEGQHGYQPQKQTFRGLDGKEHDLTWIIKG